MNQKASRGASLGVLKRVLGYMMHTYKWPFVMVVACILISSIATVATAETRMHRITRTNRTP